MNDHCHAHSHPHTVKDPVCGMDVDPTKTAHRATHAGATHYFCSASCRTKFEADPPKYLMTAITEAPALSDAIYTCPMHPEVRQVGAGACPICGMALEPVEITAENTANPELRDMTRRLWLGLALALPAVVIEMGGHVVDMHHLVPRQMGNWIQLIFATPVVLWAGWPFFVRAWRSLVTLKLNMFTLIAMGTGVSWTYSLVGTAVPGLFPDAFRSSDGTVAVYFEAAAVITVLVLLGQVLELRAREQTSGAIKALLNLAPKTARRLNVDGAEEEVGLDLVQPGDLLRVRPGRRCRWTVR